MKKIFLPFVALLYLFCASCATYTTYDSMGRKLKFNRLAGDYSKYYDSSKYKVSSFEISSFNKANNTQPISEYITQNDIIELRKHYPDLLVLIWDPWCGGDLSTIAIASKFDSINKPVILVAENYDFSTIQKQLQNISLKDKPIYFIPSENYCSNKKIIKKLSFLKDICPTCYESYKGELIYFKGVLFKENISMPITAQMEFEDISKLYD